MQIWVDADTGPAPIKEILFRAADVVANGIARLLGGG